MFSGAILVNKLYYGDNLRVLREHIADESVDLVYLDPPFRPEMPFVNSSAFKRAKREESTGKQGEMEV
jgi:16S rRNA G966 N2-methylase RsmD